MRRNTFFHGFEKKWSQVDQKVIFKIIKKHHFWVPIQKLISLNGVLRMRRNTFFQDFEE